MLMLIVIIAVLCLIGVCILLNINAYQREIRSSLHNIDIQSRWIHHDLTRKTPTDSSQELRKEPRKEAWAEPQFEPQTESTSVSREDPQSESDHILDPISIPISSTDLKPQITSVPVPLKETLLAPEPEPEPAPEPELAPTFNVAIDTAIDHEMASDQGSESDDSVKDTDLDSDSQLLPDASSSSLNQIQATVYDVLRKIWNWIIVGEEHRPANVSAEFAIASNWLMRIGIAVIVMGVGFFLKYSIDAGWLTPKARVAMSIVTGIGMLIYGSRLFHGRYHLFAQGLTGGGIAVLYFSFFSAYYFWAFFSQTGAFVLMSLVTVVACVLSIRLNALLIALLGLLGGYGTPIMLSTGSVNYPGLLGYLLLLSTGIFVTASYKNWRLLNYLSLVCTYGITAISLIDFSADKFWQTMPFLIGFFVLYSTMSFIHNFIWKTRATVLEISALFANVSAFFFLGRHVMIQSWDDRWMAALTLCLAAFYISHVYYALSRRHRDPVLITSFIGLSAFFLTISLPIIVANDWLSVTWAVQALVMLWMARRLLSRFLSGSAVCLYAFVVGRLYLYDLGHQYFYLNLQHLTTGAFLMQLLERLLVLGIPVGALYGAHYLLTHPQTPSSWSLKTPTNHVMWPLEHLFHRSVSWIMTITAFVVMNLEFLTSWEYFYSPFKVPSITWVWLFFAFLLFRSAWSHKLAGASRVFNMLIYAIIGKLMFIDMFSWSIRITSLRYSGVFSVETMAMRILDFGAVIGMLVYFWKKADDREYGREFRQFMGWASVTLLFIFATCEVNTILYRFIPGFRSGGMSIVWSVFALGLVFQGIRTVCKSARYAGLMLFFTVVVKVFLVDLALLEPIWRIVAFVILGILIVCGSLVYLKYRGEYKSDEADKKHIESNS